MSGFCSYKNSTIEASPLEPTGNPNASQLYMDFSQFGSFFSWVQEHVPRLCSSGSPVDLLEYTSIPCQLYIIPTLYSKKCVSFGQVACLYTAKPSAKYEELKTLKTMWWNYCKRGGRKCLHRSPLPPTLNADKWTEYTSSGPKRCWDTT